MADTCPAVARHAYEEVDTLFSFEAVANLSSSILHAKGPQLQAVPLALCLCVFATAGPSDAEELKFYHLPV